MARDSGVVGQPLRKALVHERGMSSLFSLYVDTGSCKKKEGGGRIVK